MKRSSMNVCVLVGFAALNLPCIAQSSRWNGSWKADPSSLSYEGPTYSVKTDADGFTVTRGQTASPKVVCDGKPASRPEGTMATCMKDGENYRIETSRDGKTTDKQTINFSPDGKTLTRSIQIFPAEGSPYTITFTSTRVSGGPGFDGVWKQTKFQESQDTGIITITVRGNTIAFKETDNDKPVTCKLDGTETKLPNGTMSAKMVSPHTLKITYKGADGKVRRENTFTLSTNGKSLRETDITPEPSASRMSENFHKS